ncbi:flavodoxin reductase [Flavobacterium columnare]|uniref:ferredoxin--NADP reductase n=1 Tax=Flavobacterium columnare TaxID=996 RepID=UPI0007F9D549|nr:ferredoxin--NADP reductase [Flavobacterium columnare]ANO49635.1 phenylacetic acid degradation NADH oxidoreductase PaaE [Flavobacterium columnare]APT22428.1 flavodoxin reductase [Flavobacterium columnare]MBF6656026.1 flavodoxin reductase [Flavobacterium columnare]OOB83373.1 flavodoxin reductase [Flavobacterium columnare]PDS26995.1 flavodoxin reductase [Flavobacterium columnare] [Flavobacterium columnare NBRC 100251 = ATCC 23463]
MSIFYKLSIKEVKRETPNAISIAFNVPLEFKDFYQFKAGQYVTIKLTLDGHEIRRAYSLCTAPSSGEFCVTIKAIKNGTFSKFANEQLKEGHILDVGLPEGRFCFEPQVDRQRNYMGFAAGSGITPVMSILQTVLLEEPKSSFVLVYGNKTSNETIFHNQLAELQKQFLGRLTVHYVYSQEEIEGQLAGRINKSVVHTIHEKHIGQEFDKYFLCGPEEMINDVNSTLKEKGIAEKNIKFELFSTSPTIENNSSSSDTFEHTKITVTLDGDEESFEMSTKQTLLEAILKQGMDAPYSCQGGVCSSCIARVTSGSAIMKKNSILSDKEISDGLILTCQAHPTSAEISIDFDDV